ncbi:hypothetical protein DSO57_1005735 [Entomophthora muscae]|uniref:Uncharacterized protein n=1 Tax=Entomophthora muscae TaxID=34485 RepID=A0ACC2T7U2_9FUNG|nr:hypothetical protein DSO57_1005735 [Entomophthora muscae]
MQVLFLFVYLQLALGLLLGVVDEQAQVRIGVANLTSAYYHFSHAVVAYCNDTILEEWRCEDCHRLGSSTSLSSIVEDPVLQGKAIITTNEERKEVTVAFRGSNAPLNGLFTLMGGLVPMEGQEDPRKVHAGFNSIITSLMPSLLPAIKKAAHGRPDYKIILTGHSLGGALATLAANHIHKNLTIPWQQISVITFGQPRVGNLKFVQWYNSLPLTMARVANINDPITLLPLSQMGYYHTLNEIFLTGPNTRICSTSILEDPLCSIGQTTNPYLEAHHEFWDLRVAQFNCKAFRE